MQRGSYKQLEFSHYFLLVSPFLLERDGRGYFLKCKNRPNAPAIGTRAGLSVAAVQAEIAAVVPMHEEPITGRELATGPIPS